METFEQWQESVEAQLIIEQSGCDLIYLEQVWNASKVSALNGVMEMVSNGTLIVNPKRT